MATELNLDSLSKVIKSDSLSFENIEADLLNYITALPDGQAWKDFYVNSSDGRILLKLISGLASFKVFHDFSRIRESSLDHATVPTNVFNLAANKGYLAAPSYCPEFNLHLKLTSSAVSTVVINKGDIVAILGNYYMYAANSYQISSYVSSIPVKCYYGYLNTYNQSILTSKKYDVSTFTTRDKFISSQMETLEIDSNLIELSSDSSISSDLTKFVLRRVLYFTSKVYFGNGIIGYYNSQSKNLVYKCLSYDTDILEKIDDLPTLISPNLILDKKELTLNPSFDPDIEQVRNVARYYPIDGRVVQDIDYKVVILKYFKSYLYDILSINIDTDQNLTLLINNTFTLDTKNKILELLSTRMALGIQVNIFTKLPAVGKSFAFTASISSSNYYTSLYSDINSYFSTLKLRFFEVDKTISALDFCLELSSRFGIKFTPTSTNSLIVLKDDFLSNLSVSITLID